MPITAGDWYVNGRDVFSKEGGMSFCVATTVPFAGSGERLDNALMMAAAPALFRELKKALDHITIIEDRLDKLNRMGFPFSAPPTEFSKETARYALAKAMMTP